MSNSVVRVSTVYNELCRARDEIVEKNKIKHPEYDPYIEGWDDCTEWFYERFQEGKHKDGME